MTLDAVRKLSPFDRLLYWINERESIRRKKELGLPRPWTDDDILNTYRFCNVRRMDDKVSDWLYRQWYRPYRNHPNSLAAAALARHFNLPKVLGQLTSKVYRIGEPDWEAIARIVRVMKAAGHNVFNAAYMVRGIGEVDKTEMVVNKVVGPLHRANVVLDTSSMRLSVEALLPHWGFSSFMAGQVVADLRWALTGTWKDRNTWAPYGPGSSRGLTRLLGSDKGTMETALRMMRDGLPPGITKRLEAMDYQNCLCEWDKYERALQGEGRPKQLYRETV